MKNVLKWTLMALVVASVLVIARDPAKWLSRWQPLTVSGTIELPASYYEPRTPVEGGNQPPAPREDPAAESLSASALQSAAEYAASQDSLALIVTRHGYIVFEKYWKGSSLDTVVDSRGLGRVVAALATGVAISERKIGWPDEPVGYLKSEWAQDPRGTITVRNLLQLSSGLDGHRVAAAPPGTRWLDQPVDPDLLAEVIQKATGMPYAQYLSQSIWRPIGAGDASLWLGSGGLPHADEGFFARQGDWLRVAELLLHNGNYQGNEVIIPRWVPQMLQPSQTNPGYGSYVRLGGARPSAYATDDVLVVDGHGSRLWLVPSLEIAILRTGGPVGRDWDDGRIPNLIVRGAKDYVPAAARPGADLRLLVPNH